MTEKSVSRLTFENVNKVKFSKLVMMKQTNLPQRCTRLGLILL